MNDLIATTIFFTSLMGMGIIIVRKIPLLGKLPFPEKNGQLNFLSKLIIKIKEKIKNIFGQGKFFYSEIFIQKLLLKIKILSLRMANKAEILLQQVREKYKKKKIESDNYWEEIKKIKKEK